METMSFRSASIRDARILGGLLVTTSVMLAVALWNLPDFWPVVGFVPAMAGLYWGIRGLRTRFVVADWGIRYRSIFQSVDVDWEDLGSVEKMVGFTHHRVSPRRPLGAYGEKVMLVASDGNTFVCHDIVQDYGSTGGAVDLVVDEMRRRHARFMRDGIRIPSEPVRFAGPEAILKALVFGGIGLVSGMAVVAVGFSPWAGVPGLALVASVFLVIRSVMSRIEFTDWGVKARWVSGSAKVPWSSVRGVGKMVDGLFGIPFEKVALVTEGGEVVLHALVQPPSALRGRVDVAVAEAERWMESLVGAGPAGDQ